ncbi:MAG: formimidoylglutamase [Bacillota bacterium]
MYIHPARENWQGRKDSELDFASFRYHQRVQLVNISSIQSHKNQAVSSGIIGFQCEEGVRRNKGRPGAAAGPEHVRKALAKLPWHGADRELFDVGDIVCEGDRMEAAQEELGNAVSLLLHNRVSPIIIGGGHETLYGHYLGVRKHIGQYARLGIINIDAHFDLRPYEEKPSSGTMFRQILDQDASASYFCVGIQKHGNTARLFEDAKKYGVEFIHQEDTCEMGKTKEHLDRFMAEHDFILLTLCTDSIDSSYAPGVSAPSPFGLHPVTVKELLRHIVSKDKTLSFDISEVNPALDENNKTVLLAAHLVSEVILNT